MCVYICESERCVHTSVFCECLPFPSRALHKVAIALPVSEQPANINSCIRGNLAKPGKRPTRPLSYREVRREEDKERKREGGEKEENG